jgi:hypothetical protein
MNLRRLALAIGMVVLAVALAGCGPDPKEEYATSAIAVVDEWGTIVGEWNAEPGDAKVAAKFASLEVRAKAITPPEGMAQLHRLLLTAMEAERKSFEAYALGKKEYARTSRHRPG